ncbi:MAG: 1-(5-phosphoribosyl)-5-((5-phosphoribosylamino)methylideneamino)imidazole-4-carboxamide isomerase [Anaerolineaceae bacterium]|nr:1-(5-phosphoribosyl)-5-((5-phosphoribosylamino)methylideneamino)imidazole-4-carboxamide isomerase [Anaerolineaceae bacterium]
MIVLPAIDLRAGRCVRLRQGRPAEETVYDADPAQAARRWVEQGAAWLHVVNLDGAFAAVDQETAGALPLNLQRLAEIRRAVPGTPIQFGGGVRSLAAMALALELGATRVVIGTAAVHRPELLSEAVRRFGAERVVAGIDAREGRVATHGWRQASDVTAEELGMAVRRRGVRRAVYTDISRDGMLRGVAVDETAALARATGLRVIASGGVASPDDVRRLVPHAADGVEGVIVGQALYTGAVSLPELLRLAGTQAA